MPSRGYTFVEVLTITAVAGLLIVTLTGVVGNSLHINRSQSEQVRTTEEARKQLERTANAIRSSQNITQGNQVKNWLQSGDNFEITFYSNVDTDAAIEKVHYFVDPSDSTTIKLGITKPDSNGNYTGSEEVTALTHSLRNRQPDQALFYYKDKQGTVLGTPLSSTDLGNVVTVGMAWRIDANPADNVPAQDIGTEVTPRHNELAFTGAPDVVPTFSPMPSLSPTPAPTSIGSGGGGNGAEPTPTATIAPPVIENCHANSETSITCSGVVPPLVTGDRPPVQLYDPITNPPIPIGTPIPPDIDHWTNTENGLLSGRDYDRFARAIDAGGTGAQSAKSNTVTVSTPCTIGNTVGSPQPAPSLTPTPTANPNQSPTPTPRFTSSTAPCFTVGLAVTTVFREDPWTRAITDESAKFWWWAVPANYTNYGAQRVNAGTPSAFYQLEVPQGQPYIIGLMHAPNTPWGYIPQPGYNGPDECNFLTDSSWTWGWLYPDGSGNYIPLGSPLAIAPGSGGTNLRLVFYYTVDDPDSGWRGYNTYNADPRIDNERGFFCRLFEQNGRELRPNLPILRVQRFLVRSIATGIVLDYSYYYEWGFRNADAAPLSVCDNDDWYRCYPEYDIGFNRWAADELPGKGLYSLYLSYDGNNPFHDLSLAGCNHLTDGTTPGNGLLYLPLEDPANHLMDNLEFWADQNSGSMYLNCLLVNGWNGTVLRRQSSNPIGYTVTVGKVYKNGVLDSTATKNNFFWKWSVTGLQGEKNVGDLVRTTGGPTTITLRRAYWDGLFDRWVGFPATDLRCTLDYNLNKNSNLSVNVVVRTRKNAFWGVDEQYIESCNLQN